MPIKNRLAEMHEEITGWRRDFHENPELLYEVHRTAAKVADLLRGFGCDEVVEGIGQTGVVGVIEGKANTSGRVVLLRADMDALPIIEAVDRPYKSKVPGKMHACGHDGHTAMLLGAAKYLAETRNFDGKVVLMFQPAEEGGAGAKAMIDDGLLTRWGVTEGYGMHNMPGMAVGQFSIKPGPFYAATDQFEITVIGRGGHAAKPNATIDTTLVAAQMVVALQSIVSRNVDPLESAVVSVCTFRTESEAFNVIPERVTLKGTLRTFKPEIRKLGEERIRAIAAGVAATFGATAEVWWNVGYPATVNHEVETEYAAEAARRVAGSVQLQAAPQMGGEDFAYVLEAIPGAYIQIGNGDSADVHHPAYDFNDEALPAGASFWVELAESRLKAA